MWPSRDCRYFKALALVIFLPRWRESLLRYAEKTPALGAYSISRGLCSEGKIWTMFSASPPASGPVQRICCAPLRTPMVTNYQGNMSVSLQPPATYAIMHTPKHTPKHISKQTLKHTPKHTCQQYHHRCLADNGGAKVQTIQEDQVA